MTYLDLLAQLTSQVTGAEADKARQAWVNTLTRHNVLPYAMGEAPGLMMAAANNKVGRDATIEVIAMNALIHAELDWWSIQDVARATVKQAKAG
jgi:hypothetical protein